MFLDWLKEQLGAVTAEDLQKFAPPSHNKRGSSKSYQTPY
jgi:hypothetical protein